MARGCFIMSLSFGRACWPSSSSASLFSLHIFDKGQVTIRYFGLYANAHRGKVRKSDEVAHKLIIAFLTDYAVVDRIINHLKLTFVAAKPPPSHLTYQELMMSDETSAEYFS